MASFRALSQGARYGLTHMAAASLSPMTCSFSGSQRIDAAELQRHVGQEACNRYAVSVLDIAERAFACPHRIQPILLIHRESVFAAETIARIRLHAFAFGRLDPRRLVSYRNRPARRQDARKSAGCR